jgi:hypothetical protein
MISTAANLLLIDAGKRTIITTMLQKRGMYIWAWI